MPCMSKIRTKIKQYSLGITINNQKRNLICKAPTKAQFILYELVSQISLFWNYEKLILTYEKSKETEDYLKIRVELKLFEKKTRFLKFIWKLESRELFENWGPGN